MKIYYKFFLLSTTFCSMFCIQIVSLTQIWSPKIKIELKHDNVDTEGVFN